MIELKHAVKLDNLSPQIVLAIVVAAGLIRRYSIEPCVVTSVNDSRHRIGSLHYQGRAVDLRTRHLNRSEAESFADEVRDCLGPDFDVILEWNPPHLHIEYDPKPPKGIDADDAA